MRLFQSTKFVEDQIDQEMIVSVDYNPRTEDAEIHEVTIYQEGKKVCEISTLLDKTAGSPLCAILDAIDWRAEYRQMKSEVADYDEGPVEKQDVFARLGSILTPIYSPNSK